MPTTPDLRLMNEIDLFAGNEPDTDPESRDFIRPTQVYVYHYQHNGETFTETLRAYDFADAIVRCGALGVELDGLIER